MIQSQPITVPITVFQPDCVRHKCDDWRGHQAHALKASSADAKSINIKAHPASSVRHQTAKIRNLTHELRDRRQKRQSSPSLKPFNSDEPNSNTSTVLTNAYQRVATTTLVRVDDARARLRSLENKIAGMRDDLLHTTKPHELPVLHELKALEDEKMEEENELYTTIFDLQVLKDTSMEFGPTTNELVESMENEIIALTTENERLEQQVSEHMCAIEFSNAVILAQEAAFAQALQTKDDEICDLLDQLNDIESSNEPSAHIKDELAALQHSLKDVEMAKSKLEAACRSLYKRMQHMEEDKAHWDQKVLELEKEVSRQQSDIDEAAVQSSKLQIQEMLLDNERMEMVAELDAARSTAAKLETENASLEKSALMAIQEVDQLKALRQADAVAASNTKADLEREQEMLEERIADMTTAILELQSARCADVENKDAQEIRHADALNEINQLRRVRESERELYKNAIVYLEEEHETMRQDISDSTLATKAKFEGEIALLQQSLETTQREMNDRESQRRSDDAAGLQALSNLQSQNGDLEVRIKEMRAELQEACSIAEVEKSNLEASVVLLQRNMQIVEKKLTESETSRRVERAVASQTVSDLQEQNRKLEVRLDELCTDLRKVCSSTEATKAKLEMEAAFLSHKLQAVEKEKCETEAQGQLNASEVSELKSQNGILRAKVDGLEAEVQKARSSAEANTLQLETERTMLERSVRTNDKEKHEIQARQQAAPTDERNYGVLEARIIELQAELQVARSASQSSKSSLEAEVALLQETLRITEQKNSAEATCQSDIVAASYTISNLQSENEVLVEKIKALDAKVDELQSARQIDVDSEVMQQSKNAAAICELGEVQEANRVEPYPQSLVEKDAQAENSNETSMGSLQSLEDCVRSLGFLGFYVPTSHADNAESACDLVVEPSVEPSTALESKRSLDCIAELAFLFL